MGRRIPAYHVNLVRAVDSVNHLGAVQVQNLKLILLLAVVLIFGGGQSYSQDASIEEVPTIDQGNSCKSEMDALRTDLELAASRVSQLEINLDETRTLSDNLSGQVRNAQKIIRELEEQRDRLEQELNGSGGDHCPSANTTNECPATASEVNDLRAQLNACTAGADPDGALQASIEDLRKQVAKVTAERDALQALVAESQAETDPDEIGTETFGTVAELGEEIDSLNERQAELASELADTLAVVETITAERDRALAGASEAQMTLDEVVTERDVAREELAQADALISELRTTAAIAIGAASGALSVCEESPIPGGVILADEAAANSFKAGLGMLGDDMMVLVSPVPAIRADCALQPIAELLAPASENGNAYTVDFGTLSPEIITSLPRSVDCEALLETNAVQDVMADAIGFGSAKRAIWVQDDGAAKLCGSRNGRIGLLPTDPRNQSAVFFLTARTF